MICNLCEQGGIKDGAAHRAVCQGRPLDRAMAALIFARHAASLGPIVDHWLRVAADGLREAGADAAQVSSGWIDAERAKIAAAPPAPSPHTAGLRAALMRCVALMREVAGDIKGPFPALARDIGETLDAVSLAETLAASSPHTTARRVAAAAEELAEELSRRGRALSDAPEGGATTTNHEED